MRVGELMRALEFFPPDFDVVIGVEGETAARHVAGVFMDLIDDSAQRIGDAQTSADGYHDVVVIEGEAAGQ